MSRVSSRLALRAFVVILLVSTLRGSQDRPAASTRADLDRCLVDLKTSDMLTRAAGAECARKLGSAASPAVPYLIEMLADPTTFYWDGMRDGRMQGGRISGRDSASAALRAIGEAAVDPLIVALGHEAVRTAAVAELAHMSSASVADRVFLRLNDRVAGIREGAMSVLVRRKDPRVAPILIERLNAPEWRTRMGAAQFLGPLAPSGVASALVSALDDADLRVRLAAVDSLGVLDFEAKPLSPDRQRVLAALEKLERAIRSAYTKRTDIDARTKALMELADHAFDVRRKIAGATIGNIRAVSPLA